LGRVKPGFRFKTHSEKEVARHSRTDFGVACSDGSAIHAAAASDRRVKYGVSGVAGRARSRDFRSLFPLSSANIRSRLVSTPARSSTALSRPICRSCNRQRSNWSSTSRPRRPSALRFRSRCCCARTRLSSDPGCGPPRRAILRSARRI